MSNARDTVFRNVRRSLNRSAPLSPSLRKALDARLRHPSPNVRPRIDEPLVERFLAKLGAVNAKVTRLRDLDGVSETVEEHMRAFDLGTRLVAAPDPELDAIRWSNRLEVQRRAAVGEDLVSVTGAFAGIAESGTLVLLSGPQRPTTLNFLPGDHLVVLAAERVLPTMEDVWARLRGTHGAMPRTVNLITGPSRTADVEQTMQEGAHGPRRLHLILIDESSSADNVDRALGSAPLQGSERSLSEKETS